MYIKVFYIETRNTHCVVNDFRDLKTYKYVNFRSFLKFKFYFGNYKMESEEKNKYLSQNINPQTPPKDSSVNRSSLLNHKKALDIFESQTFQKDSVKNLNPKPPKAPSRKFITLSSSCLIELQQFQQEKGKLNKEILHNIIIMKKKIRLGSRKMSFQRWKFWTLVI